MPKAADFCNPPCFLAHLRYNDSKLAKAELTIPTIQRKGCPGNTKQMKFTVVCSVERGKKKVRCIRFSKFDADFNMEIMITELWDIWLLTGIDGNDLLQKKQSTISNV